MQVPRWLTCTLKFEKHSSRHFFLGGLPITDNCWSPNPRIPTAPQPLITQFLISSGPLWSLNLAGQ